MFERRNGQFAIGRIDPLRLACVRRRPAFWQVMKIVARLRIERRLLQAFERLRRIEVGFDIGIGALRP